MKNKKPVGYLTILFSALGSGLATESVAFGFEEIAISGNAFNYYILNPLDIGMVFLSGLAVLFYYYKRLSNFEL